jgi:serine/threonine protein kinase
MRRRPALAFQKAVIAAGATRHGAGVQDMTGRLLGSKYRLVREMARGSMGAIWRAEHVLLRLPVAVKFMQLAQEGWGAATPAGRSDAMKRFLSEARIAAAAHGPHVVQVFDYGMDQGTPYLVMELLEGESLAERLRRVGCLSAQETAEVLLQVASALERIHELGIVHRDLKPQNIFLVEGDELLAKILDFGVARVSDEALLSTLTPGTRTGDLIGTPNYMSPEQLQDRCSLDQRSDVWALGVIAFECLLGRLPFVATHLTGMILAICSGPLPVPSLLRGSISSGSISRGPVSGGPVSGGLASDRTGSAGAIPRGFDGWFARACARDPDRRYPSAIQAALALRALCRPPQSVRDVQAAEVAGASEPLPSGLRKLWTGLFRRPGVSEAEPVRRRRRRC